MQSIFRKFIRLIAIFFLTVILNTGFAQAQTGGPVTGGSLPALPRAATPLQYNTLYASANSDLWMIDTATGVSTYIGPIGFSGTDIAFSGKNLYGVSFSDFLSIDPTTGTGQVIGAMGYGDVNALTVGLDGVFYAATVSGAFITINPATGAGTLIGYFGAGMGSSGDLAYRYDNHMFASITRNGYSDSWLAEINMVNGTATPIGDMGYSEVYGLSYRNGNLYGVSAWGDILRINNLTGAAQKIGTSSASFWGLATSGQALTGSITTPTDFYTTGPASIQITANADYPGGNGVMQVEFYVLYDNDWHSLGADKTAPYTTNWSIPDVKTQQILLRIDVVGNDGYRAVYAGGVRHVNFLQSMGTAGIVENWVPQRAYLNQRSLSPKGDWKCNVSSLAMILAMDGFIGKDYQSMAAQANAMYPAVAPGDEATVQTVWDELRSISSDPYKCDSCPAATVCSCSPDVAWQAIKSSVNSGNPVIIDSLPGFFTTRGHFLVGVGYQEAGTLHSVIAYDPYGEWAHALNTYYANAQYDPLSHVGQWVYYDFSKLDGSDYYVFAAHSPTTSIGPTNIVPTSAPDASSDESRLLVSFDDRQTFFQFFLPSLRR